MAKQFYEGCNFRGASLAMIDTVNTIVDDYIAQGYRLTVRQLYYQLVARGHIPNTVKSYNNTVVLVSNARLAGLVDWDAIEDRTRSFIKRSRWQSGSDVLNAVAQQFHMDMWEGQESRVFVIVEKEALAGVLENVCHELDMPLLAARGYPSGTVLREFALTDLRRTFENNQRAVILHLGDHDPSGIDMTRDLLSRIGLFAEDRIKLTRIALTMDQIEEQNPPPNPAKTTDSRFEQYAEEFGDESWELDALQPQYLVDLVRTHAQKFIDKAAWSKVEEEIEDVKTRLETIAEDF